MSKTTKLLELENFLKEHDPKGEMSAEAIGKIFFGIMRQRIAEEIIAARKPPGKAEKKKRVPRAKTLTLFNFHTKETLIKLPLEGEALTIKYKTHPNNRKLTQLGSRPLSLAELLRMPSHLFLIFYKSLSKKNREELKKIIDQTYRATQLNDNVYQNFTRALKMVA